MTTIRILDLETQNIEYLGHTAGTPHCPDNYIVQAAWRDDVAGVSYGEVTGVRFASKEEEQASDWFNLDGVDLLVAHNAMYEMSWFLTRYRDVILPFIKRGGRVLCTAVAEYLLSHQNELYPRLDEVAPKYGGSHKVDGIKVLWEQGYKTSEIDQELLWEYLAGPEGDVANTALVFYGQLQKLQDQGMWRMYLERCDAMVAFAMCEWVGLYVDMPTAERNLAAQEEELAGIQEEIKHLLPEDMPEELVFNWSSGQQMSALMFGGGIKYKRKVPYDPPKMEKADFYKLEDGSRVLATENAPDNCVRYKSGKNRGLPKVFREDTDVEKLKLDDAVYRFPGLVKINSLPPTLRGKFDNPTKGRKGDWVGNRTLADGTPEYSTKSEVIEVLWTHLSSC